MQPFENPLCTKEGIVFDLMNIVPFLKKYGLSPVTGEKMSFKELIRLNFHKNSDDKYHCPVTFKIFNENSHIVAIKPTGHVYAHEAIDRLNLKAKNMKDLITDEPFERKDIITIQDPTHLDKFNIAEFYHIKKNLKVTDEDEEASKKDPRHNLKSINHEAKNVLDELDRDYKPSNILEIKENKVKIDKFNAAGYSTGAVSASFTSTAVTPQTQHIAAAIDEDVLRYERVKKKGYVRILTNYGPLNLELFCDMVPKTCENFMKLAARGYYNDTIFHRSIRNFMIQGGDPTGTGKGGESAWGGTFRDEFKPNLTHSGRGVLSMANSGENTNKSQFFITYRSAKHLDRKHSVFGKVVGGIETLDKMEKIEVDKDDRPKKEIKLENCVVFVNPFDEADEQLKKEREDEEDRQAAEDELQKKKMVKKMPKEELKVFKQGVGKYINSSAAKRILDKHEEEPVVKKKPKSSGSGGFGNFSSW